MQRNTISVQKKAFYYTLGELNSETKHIWFVLHGYAQLAKYFIKKFQLLQNEETFIVAPEALSKFYVERMSGRIGATWMTKEERQSDIDDYINYLNQLFNELKENFSSEIKIHILGFSQGAATASRWVDAGQVIPTNLILWSGAFAHDLKLDFHTRLENVKAWTVSGNQDKIMTPNKMATQIKNLAEKGFQIHELYFEGGHEVHQETLALLQSKIQL